MLLQVLQPSLPPSSASLREACGPPEQAGAICTSVYEATSNASLARLADLLLARPAQVLLILVVAFVVNRLLRRGIRRLVASMTKERVRRGLDSLRPTVLDNSDELPTLRRLQRAQTIGGLLQNATSVAVWGMAVLTALETIGVNLGPLVAGAGIVGVALGFGAQNLVRDLISGIFMLLEDQYGIGDVIDVGPAVGTVEGVGLRSTRVRDVDGVLWHVPNGEIHRVGNMSQGWSRALLDIEVAWSSDLQHAIEVIKRVAEELWKDEQWSGLLLGQPEVWGVEELGENGIKIRLVAKTRPLEQWKVERELRARIKAAFEREGVEIPLVVASVWPERPDAHADTDPGRDGAASDPAPGRADPDPGPRPDDAAGRDPGSGGREGTETAGAPPDGEARTGQAGGRDGKGRAGRAGTGAGTGTETAGAPRKGGARTGRRPEPGPR